MVTSILVILIIGLVVLLLQPDLLATVRNHAERYLGLGNRSESDSLRKNEEKYRTLFEVSADAYMILDGGRFVECNQAALKLFGYRTKEEFCRVTPTMVSPKFQPNGESSEVMAARQIETALQQGHNRFEWIHQRKDGTDFPTEIVLNGFQFEGRTVIQAMVRDIAQRKQKELETQQSRELLEKIFNSIPVGVAIISKEKKILKVNRAALKLTEYADETELVGHICHKAFCPAKEGRCPVLDLEKTVDESERNLVTKSKRQVPILKTVAPIFYEGEECLLESFVDISTQKQNEEKIKNSAAALETTNKTLEQYIAIADSATRAKSEFLANMSHEIRTPMTAILGFADLLREQLHCKKNITPECMDCVCGTNNLEYINTIFANGQHLLRIINDILDLSKIEAEKIDIIRTTCSLAALTNDIRSLMEVRTKAKNLKFEVETIGELPDVVLCDTTRIRQILINLLANAIKFTETGKVRLVTQLIHGKDGKPPLLRFDVIDTGIGMTKEQTHKIFRPFEQADTSTSRRFGGTGLGLTISKRLAMLLGGDLILAKSVPGEGSSFILTVAVEIPHPDEIGNTVILDTKEKPTVPTTSEKIRLDCRVLLAEDGLDNQRLISVFLKQAGAKVTIVENGMLAFEEALQAEREGNPYDVVLMDMQMPIMDGYEATRKLRLLAYSRPIIALTAHAMAGDKHKCKAAGCDDYVAKPIERQSFLATVAKYASRTVDNQPINTVPPQ